MARIEYPKEPSAMKWSWTMLLALVAGLWPAAAADETPERFYDRETPVVRVYRQTHKAVVNISGRRTVRTSRGFDWPSFDLWGPGYRREIAVLGSGVLVHQDGYIVTNAHIAANAEKLKVSLSDGREFPAEVVSTDEQKDLAVVRIDTHEELPFIHLGTSNDLMIGETVIAIGNPYGFANTVTSGVISAIGRDIEVADGFWLRGLIQTDAPINPGNSGGPLLNVHGDLIGVNTAIRAEAQNIGFAIPVDTLVDNLREMLMPENMRRVQLGLSVGRRKTVGGSSGLVVMSVAKGSPADKKGIAIGDLLTAVDGQALNTIIDFYIHMMGKSVGEPIRVTYLHLAGGRFASQTVELTLVERPLPDGQKLAYDLFQMRLSPLTESVARRFGFESAYPILIITELRSGGTAAASGLKEGDLILEIDGTTVRNPRELSLAMEKKAEGDLVRFQIMRISIGVFGQIERRYQVTLKAQMMPSDPRRFY